MSQKTNKKISKEILTKIGSVVGVVLTVIIAAFLFLVQQSITISKESKLTLESKAAANSLSDYFSTYTKTAELMAQNPEIQQLMFTTKEKESLIENELYNTVFQNMTNIANADAENIMATWIADIDANMVTQSDKFTSGADWNFYDRAWSVCTKTGETILTEPYTDASTGNTIISAVAPVYEGEDILGVAGLDISLTHLVNMFQNYKIGTHGYLTLFSEAGNVMINPDESIIGKNLNTLNVSKKLKDAVQSKSEEFLSYTMDGVKKYGFSTPVGNTGCMIVSNLPRSEYYQDLIIMILCMLGVAAIGTVIIVIGMKRTALQISKPISELNKTALKLADGDLDVELNITAENEIGELGNSIRSTVERLKQYIAYINETSGVLQDLSEGKLKIQLKQDYKGEFQKLKTGLLNVSDAMTKIIKNIETSSAQVSSGSKELANAAQSLAETAGTQAAAVEELVATSTDITEQVKQSRIGAEQSAKETEHVTRMVEESKGQMNRMMEAMKNIQNTSNRVVSIIQTIEEIADQTNLLSLNASIEAARAGEAGRGFAVVAGEIGKLADESSKAANNTKELIELSIEEIKKGNTIAEKVFASLQETVSAIETVNGLIKDNAKNAADQADGMEQIKMGIEEISNGIQDNSAMAEESSATSEELAAQAQLLNELLTMFQW